MINRHIVELVILIALLAAGIVIKGITRRMLKNLEDGGTIVTGKESREKIIDVRNEKEKDY